MVFFLLKTVLEIIQNSRKMNKTFNFYNLLTLNIFINTLYLPPIYILFYQPQLD